MQSKITGTLTGVLLLATANLGCDGQSATVQPAKLQTQAASEQEQVASANASRTVTAQSALLAEEGSADAEKQEKTPDVIFVPTPQPVVDRMLQVANVSKNDIVYDLGCGDGRIVVTAAKRFGTRAYGFDVDPKRVAEAKDNVRKNGVEHLVTIQQKDVFELDLTPASVVTLYLLPELNVKLIPQLKKLRSGSRVVSHDFDMKGVRPDRHLIVGPPKVSRNHDVYLWTVPLQKE